jgi:hypothetical protein
MKNLIYQFSKIGVVSLLLFTQYAQGQSFADSLMQDDRDIAVSIAPYVSDVRSAILDVSQYPQALVKLQRIQSRSSQSFQDLISQYPQEEQEKFYEISRFPDLISQLTSSGQKIVDIKPFLRDYPQQTQDKINDVCNNHFDDLVQINKLYQASQAAMNKVTGNYALSVQNDFQKIISMPDVMDLLTDNIDLTMSLGESYKNDPVRTVRQLDSLNGVLGVRSKRELEDYKREVQNRPELQQEMKTAANDYSSTYNQPVTYVTNNNYDNNPYPYWFSYPTWYSSPMWYPQPLYYQTGYYIGPGGGVVVVGLPSRGYSRWFFNSNYRRYPLIYNHYRSYYGMYRNHFNSNFYRGFHYEAHSHFFRPGGGGMNRNFNNMRPGGGVRGFNQMEHNNFNNRDFDRFNAGSFHNNGWGNMNGGGRGGNGFSGDGGRGGNGGFGGRGGGGHGGGHGGGRH